MKKSWGVLIIVLVGLIPLYPLIHSGLPITHDGSDHVARIANFYQSVSEGNMLPRWAGNLNWGYGHPILMFLYPFPSYLASAIHFMGFSFTDSVKVVFGFTFVLSGLFMYLWAKSVFGEKSGIIAGVLYMYAPYRFVDLYVRGAIGEHVAFFCVPLVFYFMHGIAKDKKVSIMATAGLSFSLASLILSHNAISIMFLPIIVFYGCILVCFSKKKKSLVISLITFSLLGILLSAFFVLPAFLEGKYTLRDVVTSSGEYKQRFVQLLDYVNPAWSFGGTDLLSKQIGIVQLVGTLVSLYMFKFFKNEKRFTVGLFLVTFIFSLFIMLPVSDFIWKSVSILQKFQFPWRFLSISVFASAILTSSSVLLFKGKKATVFTLLVCAVTIITCLPYIRVQGYVQKPESFYTGIYNGTTDTGESAPVWSVRFMEKRPSKNAEFISGDGVITLKNKNTTQRLYSIKVSSSSARIRENTLYFPNWSVYVNGVKENIEFQDQMNRGLITYNLPKGENTVLIKFEDTKLRLLANIISVLSFVSLGVALIALRIKNGKN